MSKIMNKFSLGLTVAVGVALVAYYQSDSTIEDVGEQIALRLLEILPRKNKMEGEVKMMRQLIIHIRDKRRQTPSVVRSAPFSFPPPFLFPSRF